MKTKKKEYSQSFVILVVVFGVLMGSTSSLFVRYGTAPSLILAAYRKTMATLILLPMVLINCREELKKLSITTILYSLLAGFFMAIHFFTYFSSVKYTTITASSVLAGTEVLFVSFFMFATGKEKYNLLCKIAIGLALLGGILVSVSQSRTPAINAPFGNACGLICAIAIAAFTIVSRKVRQANMSNTLFNFIAYGAAALVLNVMIAFSEYSFFGYDKINYLVSLGMAIFCSLLCHSLHTWSLGYIKPTLLSVLKVMNPILASALGFLILGELPGLVQVLGGIIVIIAIIMYIISNDRAGR